jgi:two-component sensor histidine kinase
MKRRNIPMISEGLGLWEYDLTTKVFARTRYVDELFGFASGQAGPTIAPFLDRIHPDDRPRIARHLRNLPHHRAGTSLRFDFRVVNPDTHMKFVLCECELKGADSSGRRLLGVCLDVSDTRVRESFLEKELSEVRRELDRKDVLVQEVYHRVKNNLHLLASALTIQARESESPDVKAKLESTVMRVCAVAALHDHLAAYCDTSRIQMDQFLGLLCRELARSTGWGTQCSINVVSDPLVMRSDRAVSVALIVNELVTNSMKHAYRNRPDAGSINVGLRAIGPRTIVSVEDQGEIYGMHSGRSGIGSQLIDGLAGQLGGTVTIEPDKAGTRVTLDFPTEPQPNVTKASGHEPSGERSNAA